MIVSIIAAIDKKDGIGKDDALPWHLRTDLLRFKKLTMGHHVVMGNKTFTTIGKLLPGRIMIIVSRNRQFSAEGCIVVHSVDEALIRAEENNESEVFIIGGGEIFSQSIKKAEKIYLTYVNTDAKADVFFPKINMSEWTEISKEYISASEFDDFSSDYKILVRNH